MIVEKAERSDIPDIDKKKLVASALLYNALLYCCDFKSHFGDPCAIPSSFHSFGIQLVKSLYCFDCVFSITCKPIRGA